MNAKNEFLRPEQAAELLKVSTTSLINWDREGKIKCVRTKGGHRRYLRSDIISAMSNSSEPRKQRSICYCRVSRNDQKEDLERQSSNFKNKFPEHEIIKDIGSGINFKRKGFKTILESAIRGDIKEIVVTDRDKLCRIGFEFIQQLVEFNNGKILVLNKKETSSDKELVDDII